MFKKLFFLLMLPLMAIGFIACSNDDKDEPSNEIGDVSTILTENGGGPWYWSLDGKTPWGTDAKYYFKKDGTCLGYYIDDEDGTEEVEEYKWNYDKNENRLTIGADGEYFANIKVQSAKKGKISFIDHEEGLMYLIR